MSKKTSSSSSAASSARRVSFPPAARATRPRSRRSSPRSSNRLRTDLEPSAPPRARHVHERRDPRDDLRHLVRGAERDGPERAAAGTRRTRRRRAEGSKSVRSRFERRRRVRARRAPNVRGERRTLAPLAPRGRLRPTSRRIYPSSLTDRAPAARAHSARHARARPPRTAPREDVARGERDGSKFGSTFFGSRRRSRRTRRRDDAEHVARRAVRRLPAQRRRLVGRIAGLEDERARAGRDPGRERATTRRRRASTRVCGGARKSCAARRVAVPGARLETMSAAAFVASSDAWSARRSPALVVFARQRVRGRRRRRGRGRRRARRGRGGGGGGRRGARVGGVGAFEPTSNRLRTVVARFVGHRRSTRTISDAAPAGSVAARSMPTTCPPSGPHSSTITGGASGVRAVRTGVLLLFVFSGGGGVAQQRLESASRRERDGGGGAHDRGGVAEGRGGDGEEARTHDSGCASRRAANRASPRDASAASAAASSSSAAIAARAPRARGRAVDRRDVVVVAFSLPYHIFRASDARRLSAPRAFATSRRARARRRSRGGVVPLRCPRFRSSRALAARE